MKQIKKGATSQTIAVFIEDSSSLVGAGLTGLVYNSGSLVAYYWRAGANASVVHTLATLATITTAWASGGFKEIDATNMPGWYRLDIIDAVLATGVDRAYISLKGAANMKPMTVEIMLTSYDPQDTVRLGLTALPNAAANAAGGLHSIGTGAGQIQVDGSGNAFVDVKEFGASPISLVGGLPQVDVATMQTAVATQVTASIFAGVVDDSSLTSAAPLTSQLTFRQFVSLAAAVLFGRTESSGNVFRTPDNVKVRVSAASAGNSRTSISLTPSG